MHPMKLGTTIHDVLTVDLNPRFEDVRPLGEVVVLSYVLHPEAQDRKSKRDMKYFIVILADVLSVGRYVRL